MYQETYKGVTFRILPGLGTVIFDSSLPGASLRWGFWDRFFTIKEIDIISKASEAQERKAIITRNAIERALNDQPIYTGDMRFRENV